MQDRLKELLEIGKDNPFLGDEDSADEAGHFKDPSMDDFYKSCEMVRAGTEDMRTKVNELRDIYDEALGSVVSKNKKKQEKEIEDLMDATHVIAKRLRDELQRLGKTIPDDDRLMTIDRIKKNIHTSLSEDYLDLMQDYHGIQNKHNEEMRRLVKTQVLLVDPKATDEDVDKAIEAVPQLIFASERTKAAQESLKYIQNKHTEILKLEKSLEEVHQLFVDMAVLVQEQSETINRIAFQVSDAKKDIILGTEELRQANKIRRKKCTIQ